MNYKMYRRSFLVPVLCCLLSFYAYAQNAERLGTVSFNTSCDKSQKAAFDRGVALVHDFWYEEAERQFEAIAKADPDCAMAHWGIGMSIFHQIWNRPGPAVMARGLSEMQKATGAKTDREKEYISALADFYKAGSDTFETRVARYSTAMAALNAHYPDDVDAAAFYALSLLAAEAPGDTSLTKERQALAIAAPLFQKYPDHPGLAHYIIHACDNPAMAKDGLFAARRYGVIAPSGAHAAHMGGHIFARLGLWDEDIVANVAAVNAAHQAAVGNRGGGFDELHPDDFLLYAYIQKGNDAAAEAVLRDAGAALDHMAMMPGMLGDGMEMMVPRYRTWMPLIYSLERRDWKTVAATPPVAGASEPIQIETFWAHAIANGHLKDSAAAKADLEKYKTLVEKIRKGPDAWAVEGTGAKISDGTVEGWSAYAQGDTENALRIMRETADLQDKVGQGEVDIPVREMLGDILLDLKRPKEALVEYQRALELSPNRFNTLFSAGKAAAAAGDKKKARQYFATLLKITDNGTKTARSEIAEAKAFTR